MVGDVAACTPGIIPAQEAALHHAHILDEAQGQRRRSGIAQHERKEIEDGALLDYEAPIHEQLAHVQLRIDDERALGADVREADAHLARRCRPRT